MRGPWRLLVTTTALFAPVVFGAAHGATAPMQPHSPASLRTAGVVVAQATTTTTDEERRKAKQKADEEKKKQKADEEKKKQSDQNKDQQKNQRQSDQNKDQQKNQRQSDQNKDQQKNQRQSDQNKDQQKNQGQSDQNKDQRKQTQQGAKDTTKPEAQGKQSGGVVVKSRESAPVAPSGIAKPTAEEAKPIAPTGKGAGIAVQSSQGKTIQHIDDLRGTRRETKEGNRTVIREPDRTIIRENGKTIIRHDEFDRFRYGARDVRVDQRGNETRTVVVRPNGDRIVTVYDNNGYLIRRSRILPNGREIVLIDNRGPRSAVFRIGDFVVTLPPPAIRIPRDRYIVDLDRASPAIVYETLTAQPVDFIRQPYSIDQIRYSESLRDRMPRVDLDVNFESGSWELTQDQIGKLAAIADAIKRAIDRNPSEMFLIEGHTDAVGSDVDNLSLSDRRAESVALALSQDFDVPPENLVTQGYGEQFLKVPAQGPERANRRVAVRRITPLLVGSAQ